MVKIIKSKQELMDLAKDYLKVQIIGEGWVVISPLSSRQAKYLK